MERGSEREKSLCKQDYLTEGYFSQKQWNSFCFQAGAIYKLIKTGSILEIGSGSGFVGGVLRTIGYNVDNLDINEKLEPTFIRDISLEEFLLPNKYDCVLCAEVLEHIPFDRLEICLKNIQKFSNKYAIITLPNCESYNKFYIQINSRKIGFKFGKKHSPIASMHFWELNSDDYCTYSEIRKKMAKYFRIMEEGKIFGNDYHYYYLMEKHDQI